jgi:hypothetical protein
MYIKTHNVSKIKQVPIYNYSAIFNISILALPEMPIKIRLSSVYTNSYNL